MPTEQTAEEQGRKLTAGPVPPTGSAADLRRCLRNMTELYEQLQGHPTSYSREARAALASEPRHD